ncbi:mercuric reductase [Rhodocaloribacter litoris]|uniref:dihydrolipoyl dehydrogenase family protein n=1 Tax=Rhodocaloribacter litoris TaxID=2558931 RepID=UPI00141F538B|nr:mercuric reductase [Rhodocaloribacter litoris]QXD16849.1 mercuric reductase [Rhodocaloribacter litoris]GIV60494.1 MAG: mercuric reductase [Rhodothermaceae bacterium]
MAYDYDLIVIGGGAAGLTASGLGAILGARTLMIERDRLGGDCTWYGCVPSKTLLKTAQVAHHIRCAGRYGLTGQPPEIDFARVMTRLRAIRQEIYEDADAPERYERLGVEVRRGAARFVDAHTVEIAGEGGPDRASGRYVVIAAGAGAFVPPIPGLDEVPYLTNETLFELDTLPRHLVVVGGGPIGTEMAQAFRRLGSEVTVIDLLPRLLSNDDEELAGLLCEVLEQEGVRFLLGAEVQQVRHRDRAFLVTVAQQGSRREIRADALLVATGRRPNLDGLGLDAAGIAYTKTGITVDDRCRTNLPHVYAAGDVTGRYQFTHMSEHMAKVAVTNALLKFPMKLDARHVPRVTYTDPELAHVGATEARLKDQGTRYEVFRFPYRRIDRAITDRETTGWIKVFAKKRGKILGVSILGARAGELIGEFALAMRNGISLRRIADTIHPYPTYGLGVRRAADQWYVRRQMPGLLRLVQRFFGYRGTVHAFEPGEIV